MRFVLMFKINVLGMSQEHHLPNVTLGPLYDVFRTFLQKLRPRILASLASLAL